MTSGDTVPWRSYAAVVAVRVLSRHRARTVLLVAGERTDRRLFQLDLDRSLRQALALSDAD